MNQDKKNYPKDLISYMLMDSWLVSAFPFVNFIFFIDILIDIGERSSL